MALTDILKKIIEENEINLAKIEKDFEEKKKSLKEKYEKQQKRINEEMNKKIETHSVKILEKAETLAEMESKNKLLQAKRSILEESLTKTIEQLTKSDKYEQIITDMLKKTDIKGDDVVVVPAKGKETETKNAIKESGKNYFLSEKSAAISGGFILKTSKLEVDNSFETIIKNQLRESLEIEMNKLLF